MSPPTTDLPVASLSVRLLLQLRHFALDVEFAAAPGFTAIFGPSGAGKTTVLDCIAGVRRAQQSRILLDGRELADLPMHQRRAGYVMQSLALFEHMTVEQNVAYGLHGIASIARRERVEQMLQAFAIRHLAKSRASVISGGERARVALARTLVTGPRVLLLDEPFSGLDASAKSLVIEGLRRWNAEQNVPVLYVTHSLDEVFSLAQHVLTLEQGRIIAGGPPREALAEEREALLRALQG